MLPVCVPVFVAAVVPNRFEHLGWGPKTNIVEVLDPQRFATGTESCLGQSGFSAQGFEPDIQQAAHSSVYQPLQYFIGAP